MKYLRLFEDFESYDPYELMIIPPNKKAEMIMGECEKKKPNLDIVRDLITLGANLDWQDEENTEWTALHWAASYNQIEIVQMLIEAKVDLDIQDEEGMTALHRAAERNRPEIARMLVGAGADVSVPNIFWGDCVACGYE